MTFRASATGVSVRSRGGLAAACAVVLLLAPHLYAPSASSSASSSVSWWEAAGAAVEAGPVTPGWTRDAPQVTRSADGEVTRPADAVRMTRSTDAVEVHGIAGQEVPLLPRPRVQLRAGVSKIDSAGSACGESCGRALASGFPPVTTDAPPPGDDRDRIPRLLAQPPYDATAPPRAG